MDTSEILDKIQEIRGNNNQNWMDLIRIAFKSNPEEAKKVFAKIVQEDEKISKECKKMLEDEMSNEELKNKLHKLFLVLDEKGYWDCLDGSGWRGSSYITDAYFYTSEELEQYEVKKRNNNIFIAYELLSHLSKEKLIRLLKENTKKI